MKSFAVAALAFCLLGITPAAAQDMTFSGHGVTLTFRMPDSWRADPDPGSTMILKSPDHSALITLSIIDADASDDDIAGMLLSTLHADPPTKDGTQRISGAPGDRYTSGLRNSRGVHSNIRLTVVRADAHAMIVCLALFQDELSPEQQSAVDDTIGSLGLMPI